MAMHGVRNLVVDGVMIGEDDHGFSLKCLGATWVVLVVLLGLPAPLDYPEEQDNNGDNGE